jgi:hypothetical protein
MFFMPQQSMGWVAPGAAPALNMPTPIAATVPASVAVLLSGSTDQLTSIGSPQGTDMNILGPVNLSNAVWSLYEDQIKPYGRILKKRLAEMAVANGLGHIEVDPYQLRQTCKSYAWFSVQDESAGEWVCLLPGMPDAFVDATDPTDLYPPHLWTSFSAYLDALAQGNEGNSTMPGGRYACAQELASRQLYFFAGYKLGQICHIVQLAISQKNYLGYSEGCLVPYCMSQSMVKQQRAAQQKPIASRGSRPFATWPKVREVLQYILHNAWIQKEHCIPLSNVKRIFRSQYKVELSETSLGYSKLSELLRDAFVSDLCIVELQRTGYVMIPRPEAFITHADHCLAHEQVTSLSVVHLANVDDIESDGTASPNSDASGKMATSSPKRRRPQVMEELDDDVQSKSTVQQESNLFGSLSQWSLSPSKISQSTCVGGLLQRTFIHHPPPPPTPAKGHGTGSGARIRSLSVPKDFGSPKCAFADALHSLVYLHRPVHSMPVSEADDGSSMRDSPEIESLTARCVGPAPSP